jgi:hypothetical protein
VCAARGTRLVFVVAGAVAIAAVFLPVLTPANSGYDARWYHLGIAEQYAARGAIERFNEGFINGAQPQLATWLYTWAFLCSWAGEWQRITVAYCLEFALFLATLAALPIGIRWLAVSERPGQAGPHSFSFPGSFFTTACWCSALITCCWAFGPEVRAEARVGQPTAPDPPTSVARSLAMSSDIGGAKSAR